MKSTFSILLFTLSTFALVTSSMVKSQNAESINNTNDLLYSKKSVTGKELKLFFESLLTTETITAFNQFRCLNSDKYPKIDFSETSLGMFTCGTEDIEYVAEKLPATADLRKEAITTAIEKYEADFQSLKIASSYDRYFPVTLFLQGKSQYPFRRVNVDAITWLSNNIIPSPSMEINGITAQTLYDTSLRNFLRSMKFYYDYLHNELNLDYELTLYKEMIAEEDGSLAGNWLQFWYNRKDYGPASVSQNVSPHQFMGFWLRRELDGSADVLYSALGKILNTYDKKWLTADKSNTTASFIPQGYLIHSEAAGDLNKDGLEDKVIIIKNKNNKTEAKKILVLLQDKDAAFNKDTESNTIITPGLVDLDAEEETLSLGIERNQLTIGQWYEKGNTQSVFQYIDGQLRLVTIRIFASNASGYSQINMNLLKSIITQKETNTVNEKDSSESTTDYSFPEVIFENANPRAIFTKVLEKPSTKTLSGTLLSGGGIDNYSLIIQTEDGNKIEVYCQPNCGDWFVNDTENEGVVLIYSLKNKKVSATIATETNQGRLAGPSDDEEFIFIKSLRFID